MSWKKEKETLWSALRSVRNTGGIHDGERYRPILQTQWHCREVNQAEMKSRENYLAHGTYARYNTSSVSTLLRYLRLSTTCGSRQPAEINSRAIVNNFPEIPFRKSFASSFRHCEGITYTREATCSNILEACLILRHGYTWPVEKRRNRLSPRKAGNLQLARTCGV